MSCQIRTKEKSGILYIYLEGELIINHIISVYEQIYPRILESDKVVIDLAQVTDFDTSGLQLLLCCKKEIKARKGRLLLRKHSYPVLQVIDLFGMLGVLEDKITLSPAERSQYQFRYGTKKVPPFLQL
ncbi:MAG: STAS domain-containing protein [Spirochaetota bacterium]